MLKYFSIAVLVIANLVPVAGVLLWDWDSFAVIYLFWLENVIIGGFNVLRMVVRPYSHPLELIMPLFVAPFFVLHYGAFCAGHGSFVISLFGDGYKSAFSEPLSLLDPLWAMPTIFIAASVISLYHLLDWFIDSVRHGPGSDGVKDLMVAPYRRIVVLHLTILAGGFALSAMDEPTIGVLLLIAIKTGFDVYHWRKAEVLDPEEDINVEAEIEKLAEKYPEPKVTVNGKDKYFDSFRELSQSREWGLLLVMLRIMGLRRELKAMQTYMSMRIAGEESGRDGQVAEIQGAGL